MKMKSPFFYFIIPIFLIVTHSDTYSTISANSPLSQSEFPLDIKDDLDNISPIIIDNITVNYNKFSRTYDENYEKIPFGVEQEVVSIVLQFNSSIEGAKLNLIVDPKFEFKLTPDPSQKNKLTIETKGRKFKGQTTFNLTVDENEFTFSAIGLDITSIDPKEFQKEGTEILTINYNAKITNELHDIVFYDITQKKEQYKCTMYDILYSGENIVKLNISQADLYGIYTLQNHFYFSSFDFTNQEMTILVNKKLTMKTLTIFINEGTSIVYSNNFDKIPFNKGKDMQKIIVEIDNVLFKERTQLEYDKTKFNFSSFVTESNNKTYTIQNEGQSKQVNEPLNFKLITANNTLIFNIFPVSLDNIDPLEFMIEDTSANISVTYNTNISDMLKAIEFVDHFTNKTVATINKDKIQQKDEKTFTFNKTVLGNIYGRFHLKTAFTNDNFFLFSDKIIIVNKKLSLSTVTISNDSHKVSFNGSFDQMIYYQNSKINQIEVKISDVLFEDRLEVSIKPSNLTISPSIKKEDKSILIIAFTKETKLDCEISFEINASNNKLNLNIKPFGMVQVTPEKIIFSETVKESQVCIQYTSDLSLLNKIGFFNIKTKIVDKEFNMEQIAKLGEGKYNITIKSDDNLGGSYNIKSFFSNPDLDFIYNGTTILIENMIKINQVYIDSLLINYNIDKEFALPYNTKISEIKIYFNHNIDEEGRIEIKDSQDYNFSYALDEGDNKVIIIDIAGKMKAFTDDLIITIIDEYTKADYNITLNVLKILSITPKDIKSKEDNEMTLTYSGKIYEFKSFNLLSKNDKMLLTIDENEVSYKKIGDEHIYSFTLFKDKVEENFKIQAESRYDMITFVDKDHVINVDNGNKSNKTLAIVLSICGVIVLIGIGIAIYYYVKKKSKNNEEDLGKDILKAGDHDLGIDKDNII